jgi:hypothetical protein
MNKKKIINWVIIAVIIFSICDIYLRIFGTLGEFRGPALSNVISSALGMPDAAGTKGGEFAQLLDTMHISIEEWDKPTCLPYGSPEYRKEHMVQGLFPLKECVYVFGRINWPESYCNHWNKKHCIWLRVYDYILQRPDILNQVIKIIERPCKYLSIPDSYLTQKKWKERYEAVINDTVSRSLQCNIDVKKRTLETVVLTILDSNKQRPENAKFDIIVKRKE